MNARLLLHKQGLMLMLQSKRVPNLFFAGELLDLDGPIGGYNFQAAFSTGWLAGRRLGDKGIGG